MNTRGLHLRTSCLYVLLIFGLALAGAQEPVFQDCHFEPLFTDLSSISYLGQYNETHIHGKFFTDVTSGDHTITFQLHQRSHFRFYVAPHEVDVDLYLTDAATETAITHSSLQIGTEEVIKATLDAGSYILRMNFFGVIFDEYNPTICDTFVVEAEIIPATLLASRVAQHQCPGVENLPSIDQSALADVENFQYYPSETFHIINPTTNDPSPRAVRWIKAFNFTLNEVKGKLSLWEIHATLGFNFIIGESLGLLLTHANMGEPRVTCYLEANCTTGINTMMNLLELKTMLPPGQYSLWLYDQVGEKDVTLSTCVPFTFSLKIMVEDVPQNFLTCNAAELPPTIIPGLFDEPKGYIHFAENVLVELAAGERTLPFTVSSDTYLKVLTAPHRIDIDLRIINTANNQVVAYALSFGGEEAIVTYLAPGSYALNIVFFGSYEFVFCETFYLEIAMAPKTQVDASQFCSRTTSSEPDLSGMSVLQQSSSANFTLSFDQGPYYFSLPRSSQDETKYDYSKQQVLKKTFTLTTTSSFKAHLGKSFLFGDLTMMLNSSHGVLHATHERNADNIFMTLEPDTYDFIITTGTIQDYDAALMQNFPHCIEYNLELSVVPQSQVGECHRYLRLPTTLNTIQYLGPTGIVHFDSDFVVPIKPEENHVGEKFTFTVPKRSFFRVWTEPHAIDIDFTLEENGVVITRTFKWNEEEEVRYILNPGFNYTLMLDYYRWPHTDPHQVDPACFVYHMELAITPFYTDTDTCDESLPPSNLIPSTATQKTFYSDNRYTFRQTEVPATFAIPFVVTEMTQFRAEIRDNFVWSDLSLLLMVNNDTYTFAESYYDRQDLTTLLLAPGQYVLEVHEPIAQIAEVRRCVSFYLTIAFEAESAPINPEAYDSCPAAYLPETFNSVPYLFPYNGDKLHLSRQVLIDVQNNINTKSLIVQIF